MRGASAALWLAASCGVTEPAPIARVVSAAPTGAVAPDAVEVEIAFSGALDARGLADGRFFALCRREDLRAVSNLAESAAGLGADAPVVPANIALSSNGRGVRLTPRAPLAPDARWAAVLSTRARSAGGGLVLDPDGRARTFALLFETGPAPDRVPPRPRWVVPPHGPVPPNIAALRIGFDEPVTGALALDGAPARPLALAPDLLGLELVAPLAPGRLAPSLAGVRDAAQNAPAALEPLDVSACLASAPPVAGAPRMTPGELSVSIEAALGGMGRLGAEVSALPGDPPCGAAPAAPAVALAMGEVLACPRHDPCVPGAVACSGRVEVRGLCPGRTVRARLLSEDLAAHRSGPGPWLQIASSPPRPAPALTEALADADTPESGGEYVEVVNLGTGDADLDGFALAKRGASGAFTRCAIAPRAGGLIAPGDHALVVGGAYDGRYALSPGTAIYACGANALAGGLANDRAVALALEDPLGEVVSTIGLGEPAPRCPTGALERIHPAGPDTPSNWACPGTRSPGICNRSTPPAECPKRPW